MIIKLIENNIDVSNNNANDDNYTNKDNNAKVSDVFVINIMILYTICIYILYLTNKNHYN